VNVWVHVAGVIVDVACTIKLLDPAVVGYPVIYGLIKL